MAADGVMLKVKLVKSVQVVAAGSIMFEVLKGQESFRINPFTKTNAWGLFPNTKSIFKKGDVIECYSPSGINELLIK